MNYSAQQLGGSNSFSPWGVVAARQQAPAPQQQDDGMGDMMGMAGNIGGKALSGQQGGGGNSQGFMGGGGWGGAAQGAMAGFAAGQYNYENDPVMKSGKDGFGENYPDYRAQVGGAVLGGVMGYYGLGALAGPAVIAAHPVAEPATRWAINTGDKMGGAGGALMLDPFGTVASGKYSGEELAIGALMGPAADWLGII